MVTAITHAWVKIDEDGKLRVSIDYKTKREGYSRVELEKPLINTLGWSIEDFQLRAKELESLVGSEVPLYDPRKFKDALYCMVDKHDASLGITWDTVDFWQDEMCLLKEEGC